jgi:phosphoribosylglycinamide formyltransferase-1
LSKPFNILVLVSGGGTNLKALLDAEKTSAQNAACSFRIAAVISDREGAYALERAKAFGVPARVERPDRRLAKTERAKELSDRILKICMQCQIDLVVLAGYLAILEGNIIEEYSGRIINIHPALLPKFGGHGMHGRHVHQAVLAAGETESGCTVHLVDAGTDTGPVLLQRKVKVLPGDTIESLAERVLVEEHIAIVEAVKLMVNNLNE